MYLFYEIVPGSQALLKITLHAKTTCKNKNRKGDKNLKLTQLKSARLLVTYS